jgi:hypothetical protein
VCVQVETEEEGVGGVCSSRNRGEKALVVRVKIETMRMGRAPH